MRSCLVLITLFVFTPACLGQLLQDRSIYGKFEKAVIPLDVKEVAQVLAKCFWGMGLTTCVANYQDDDIILQRNTAYYNDITDNYGSNWCLSCCGQHEEEQDTWDLYCDLDIATAGASNVYGYELRLAAMQYDGDQTVVTCPLKRTACTYEDDGVTLIGCVADNTYLIGYTLTIEVQEFDKNFNYWSGIKGCSIVAEESTTAPGTGDFFRETIIMNYPFDFMNTLDYAKPLIALLAVTFIAYVILYLTRTKLCYFCQGKLVWSQELCIRCKIVGAEPIDPVLLTALEDKGEHIQGVMPEQFPGSHKTVSFIRRQYGRASRIWNARRIREAQEAEEAEIRAKAEAIEAEKEAQRLAQEEADRHESVLGLEAQRKGSYEKKEEPVDEVEALKAKLGFDLGLGDGVGVGLDEVEKGEEDYESTYAAADVNGENENNSGEAGDTLRKEEQEQEGGETPLVSFSTPLAAGGGEGARKSPIASPNADLDASVLDDKEAKDKPEAKPTVIPYKKPWRYPKWMKIFGFRNKPKEVVPVPNPNLLPYPKHIIYAAVAHHRPPPPDEVMDAKRRAIFMEALGYVPGEELDDEGNVIVHHDEEKKQEVSIYGPKVVSNEDEKYIINGVPVWQIELNKARAAVRKAPPLEDWWNTWNFDEYTGIEMNPLPKFMHSKPKKGQEIAGPKPKKFRKKRNYWCYAAGTLPSLRLAAPFLCMGFFIVSFMSFTFILLFAGLDMSNW